jgi:chemotaxis protein MotB
MPRSRRRGGGARTTGEFWPSYVDALSSLLLIFIFVLTLFFLAQYYLGQALSGKDTAMAKLQARVSELADMLALAKSDKASLQAQLASLQATLQQETAKRSTAEAQVTSLQSQLDTAKTGSSAAQQQAQSLQDQLDQQKQLSSQAQSQVTLLNEQIAALRQQLATIQDALDASEKRDAANKAIIVDLGKRLNAALAQKVQELQGYRSEFFGKLKKILGDNPDILIVGDRFILPSEVFFQSGSADIGAPGKAELDKIATLLVSLNKEIPQSLPWVLRVDGHTDKEPIKTSQFKSNWELSAARAVAVVKYLISKGVPPQRLVAAGFGEYHPLEPGNSPAALARNRRIEFKLTEE